MLNFLNKFYAAVWKPICRGSGNLCNFEIQTPVYIVRGSACPFTNISGCGDKITGGRENNKVLVNAIYVTNECIKGNKDYVHLHNYQKCKFHSSLKHSNDHRRHGVRQDHEKRRANILIFMTVILAVSVIWGLSKMDESPYDKPAQKAEKL